MSLAASMRIAHIVYSFRVGGLENGMVNLINRLPRSEYRHAIISLTDIDPVFCQRITRDDVDFIALHKPPGQGLFQFPRVWRALRDWAPDVVHTRNLAALEMALPAWAARTAVRVHGEHGRDVDDPDGRSRRHQWMRRIYKPFVSHYVALSKELDAYLAGPIGVPAARRSLICNGVDAERFAPPAGGQRIALAGSGFDDAGLYVFGTVGRLQAVKDQAGLLRAFAALCAQSPEVAARARLAIVGDGPLRESLKTLAQELGIAPWVWFAGERTDVPAVMQSFDCFVLPSLAEGISNTVLEAMASGLPVIATDVGGNAQLVADGLSGRIVPAADVSTLAGAMLDALRDANSQRQRGAAGRARIEAQFSLSAMVASYDSLYRDLLAQCGKRQASNNKNNLGVG